MRWSGAQAELFEKFRGVGAREVAPHAALHDAGHSFNREAWRRVAQTGLFGLHVSKELGGAGLTLRDFAAAIDGFATGSGDLGLSISVIAHAGVFLTALQEFGTAEQQRHFLPKLLSGEWIGAVANSEPRGGTDVMALRSWARRVPTGFEVFSRKRSITNIGPADVVLTSARLRDDDPKKNLRMFLIEATTPRVFQQPIRDLMGLRTSATGNWLVWRAMVPESAVLSDGVRFFKRCFALERLLIGFLYQAALRRCLSRAVHHAETRLQFGEPIGRNQYVQEKIVRMHQAEQLLGALLDRTLAQSEAGQDVTSALSVIKVYGLDAALEAADDLIGLLGSRGLRAQEPAEKLLRDLMGLSILGGTRELQKLVIYREAVKHVQATPVVSEGARDALTLEVHSFANIDRSLEAALVQLAERTFPNEPSLKGRYFYDSAPDFVVVARKEGRVVGLRVVIRRTVLVGERAVRLAGVGIAVDPEHQRAGIGRALTELTVRRLRELGDDVGLAFLFSRNAESLLTSFGFRKLNAEVSYVERKSNERVVESMPCFAVELQDGGDALTAVEAEGRLHLGTGTW